MDSEEVLIVALGGRVLGLNSDNGEIQWCNEMELGGIAWVGLAVTKKYVYASASARKVFCIDRLNGETLWTASTTGLGRATLICDQSHLYICKGGLTDCFSFHGDQKWSADLTRSGKGVAAMGLTNHVVQADGRSK